MRISFPAGIRGVHLPAEWDSTFYGQCRKRSYNQCCQGNLITAIGGLIWFEDVICRCVQSQPLGGWGEGAGGGRGDRLVVFVQ